VTGNGSEPLSRVPVRVMITADYTGRIDISVAGPIKGKAGLLSLIDGVRRIVEQMSDEDVRPT